MMTEYILIGTIVALWILGGVTASMLACDGDFRGLKKHRIALVYIVWPLVLIFSGLALISCRVVVAVSSFVRRWRK